MRALRFDRLGDLAALTNVELPKPQPAPGEVLVEIRAAGLNPSDVKNVLGRFPYTRVPRTPGRDFAGVVVEGPSELLGHEVFGSGKELGFSRDGTHAQYLTLPAAGVALKPKALSFAQAACCGVPYITAADALERAAVGAGTGLLIIGAGSVGRAAAALAHCRGARTAIAVRKPEQRDALLARGQAAFLLGAPDTLSRIAEHFPAGAEVIFDTSGAWLPFAVEILAERGRAIVIAAPASGRVDVPVLALYRRGASILGVNSLLHDSISSAKLLAELAPRFERRELPPPTEFVTVPLSSAINAYRELDAGAPTKFVFTP